MKKQQILASEIQTIEKGGRFFFNELKVERVGSNVFSIIGYRYGERVVKLTGYAHEVAEYLNGYYGIERV